MASTHTVIPVPLGRGPGTVSTALRACPGADPSAPAVLVLPAMGTPAAYYDPLVAELAARGGAAAVMDLRGIGASSVRAGRGVDFGYDTLVSDAEDGMAALRAFAPEAPEVVILGHSLGGHLALLLLGRTAAPARVALVASGSPFYATYRTPLAKGVVFTLAQTARVATRALGYFPGKQIGFGGREARTVMREWSRLARRNAFDLLEWSGEVSPEASLRRAQGRVLAIEIERDVFAPRGSIEALLSKVPAADVTRARETGRRGNGRAVHHNWARAPERVVGRVLRWLGETQASGGGSDHLAG